jgi:uncharacterized DUF497 family protein
MRIDDDPGKDAANKSKHGVSLAYADQVLADPKRLVVRDIRFDYGEPRYVAYGMAEGRIWVCVYADWGETIRVISVRKANDREQRRHRDSLR